MCDKRNITIFKDSGGSYCAWILVNEDRCMYIHKDGSLHNRTDRRNDNIKKKRNGGFRSKKKVIKAITKYLTKEENF